MFVDTSFSVKGRMSTLYEVVEYCKELDGRRSVFECFVTKLVFLNPIIRIDAFFMIQRPKNNHDSIFSSFFCNEIGIWRVPAPDGISTLRSPSLNPNPNPGRRIQNTPWETPQDFHDDSIECIARRVSTRFEGFTRWGARRTGGG